MNAPTHHHYAAAASMDIHHVNLNSSNISLEVLQQPTTARIAVGKEKDRKPVDPPPVVKFEVSQKEDPARLYLHSPYFFMTCSLLASAENNVPSGTLGTALAGTLVSSLHRLKEGKDNKNTDGAYFVFSDLSVKIEGWFRLQFHLYQMRSDDLQCIYIHSTLSNPFQVYSTKAWPGMNESTWLTRTFSDQGVRLRLRKEPRALLKKRGPAHDDYEPRRYRKSQMNQQIDKESMAESDSQQNSQQSPTERNSSVDQSYTHIQDLSGRNYSQQTSNYTEMNQYDSASTKRPRTGSAQNRVPSFNDNASITSPHMGSLSMYAEPQQHPYAYSQSVNPPPQSGFYSNFNFMPSPQTPVAFRDQYHSRSQTHIGVTLPYDSIEQRSSSIMIPHPQQAGRFPQLRYNMSPSSHTSAHQQRAELSSEGFDVFGFQGRPQSLQQITGTMAPPMVGRMNTSHLGGHGSAQSTTRGPYQSNLGQTQSQNMSAGSTGGMYSSNRAPTPVSTTSAPSLETSYS